MTSSTATFTSSQLARSPMEAISKGKSCILASSPFSSFYYAPISRLNTMEGIRFSLRSPTSEKIKLKSSLFGVSLCTNGPSLPLLSKKDNTKNKSLVCMASSADDVPSASDPSIP